MVVEHVLLKSDRDNEELESMSCVQQKGDEMSNLKRRNLGEIISGSLNTE